MKKNTIVKIFHIDKKFDYLDVENFARGGGVRGSISVHLPKSSKVAFLKLSSTRDLEYARKLDNFKIGQSSMKVKPVDIVTEEEYIPNEWKTENEDDEGAQIKSCQSEVVSNYSKEDLKKRRVQYLTFLSKYDSQFPPTNRWKKITVIHSYEKDMYKYAKNSKNSRHIGDIFHQSENKTKKGKKKVRFCVISDTHGYHDRVDLSGIEADVLLHCGDFTDFSNWEKFTAKEDLSIPKKVHEFNEYLGKLKKQFKNIVVVSGNHDTGFQDAALNCLPIRTRKSLLSNAIYLNNSGVTIEGIKIYGPSFNASHEKTEDEDLLERRWDGIPRDTNVIATHFPPYYWNRCTSMFDAVQELGGLRVSCFGHFHYRNFSKKIDKVTYIAAPVFHTQSMEIQPVVLFDYWI